MKAIFTIPEDSDMIPVNDQTRPPEEMVAMIREALTQRSSEQARAASGDSTVTRPRTHASFI